MKVRQILHGPRLQPKLVVGPPDDAYEREADRVAEAVMRMPEPLAEDGRPAGSPGAAAASATSAAIQRTCPECEEEVQRQVGSAPSAAERIQRSCPECEAEMQLQPAEEPEEEETLRRQPAREEVEEKLLQAKETPGTVPQVTPELEARIGALHGNGSPLPAPERAFFEPRFGSGFGGVRIHKGDDAAELARALSARAFTTGRSIVFGQGEYRPGTSEGRRLLAHELTHVAQQDNRAVRAQGDEIRRAAATCPTDWRSTVNTDDTRAKNMIDVARAKISSYDGTTPDEVRTALDRHFKASSTGFARWISLNLHYLRIAAALASYDCEDTSSWWCGSRTLAYTLGVPFVDIRICHPLYFSDPDEERSATLIHEWVHKYGWNIDLGYSHEEDYPDQWTLTALINADPWSEFVKDVQ